MHMDENIITKKWMDTNHFRIFLGQPINESEMNGKKTIHDTQ
jgi:hypothetical protein